MEIGQGYTINVENASIVNGVTDLIQIQVGSGVPVLFERAVITCGTTSQLTARVQLVKRSSGGSGSVGSVTPRAVNTAGPAASMTVTYGLTGQGTIGNTFEPQQWNIVVPYEMDYEPAGILAVPGEFLCIALLAGLGSTLPFSMMVKCREIK